MLSVRRLVVCLAALAVCVLGAQAVQVEKLHNSPVVSLAELNQQQASSIVQYADAAAVQAPATATAAPETTTPVIKKDRRRRRRKDKKGGHRSRPHRRAKPDALLVANSVDATAPLPASFKPVAVIDAAGKKVQPDNNGYFTIKTGSEQPQVSNLNGLKKPTIAFVEMESTVEQSPIEAINKATIKAKKEVKAEKKKKKQQKRRRRRANRRDKPDNLLKANEADASAPLPQSYKPVKVEGPNGAVVSTPADPYKNVDNGVPKAPSSFANRPVILLETGSERSGARLHAAKVVAADGKELKPTDEGYTMQVSMAIKNAELPPSFHAVHVDPALTNGQSFLEIQSEKPSEAKKQRKALAEVSKRAEAKRKALAKRLKNLKKAVKKHVKQLSKQTKSKWNAVRVIDSNGKEVKPGQNGYNVYNEVPKVESRKFKKVPVVGAQPAKPETVVPLVKNRRGRYVKPNYSFMETSSTTQTVNTELNPEELQALEAHVKAAQSVAQSLEAQKSHADAVLEKLNFHAQRLAEASSRAEAEEQSLAEVSALTQAWTEEKNAKLEQAHIALVQLNDHIEAVHAQHDAHVTQLNELQSTLHTALTEPGVSFLQVQNLVTKQLADAITAVKASTPAQLDEQVKQLTAKLEELTSAIKRKF